MFALLITTLLLHPVHETVSEVEWNSETGRLEVALRLDPLDEQWLRKKYAGGEELSEWATTYLRERFRVTEKAKTEKNEADADENDSQQAAPSAAAGRDPDAGRDETADYRWVGREDRQSYVWWYFEIEPADKTRPRWIDVRLLWERDDQYVSRILLLGQTSRRAVICTRTRPKVSLDPTDSLDSAHEPTESPKFDRGGDLDR